MASASNNYYHQNFPYLTRVFQSKEIELLHDQACLKEINTIIEENDAYLKRMKESSFEGDYCTFHLKTGACKYGFQCKRRHVNPMISKTVMVRKMYRDKLSDTRNIANRFEEILLEIDEEKLQSDYEVFYKDVIEEFRKFGEIKQFKCCNNLVGHLRGNVFVEYEQAASAIQAYIMLDGRYYDGRQLNICFSLINDWKQAICAYENSCPKIKECNFLHVFENLNKEYQVIREKKGRAGRDDKFKGKRVSSKKHRYRSRSKSRSRSTSERRRKKSSRRKRRDDSRDRKKSKKKSSRRRRSSGYDSRKKKSKRRRRTPSPSPNDDSRK